MLNRSYFTRQSFVFLSSSKKSGRSCAVGVASVRMTHDRLCVPQFYRRLLLDGSAAKVGGGQAEDGDVRTQRTKPPHRALQVRACVSSVVCSNGDYSLCTGAWHTRSSSACFFRRYWLSTLPFRDIRDLFAFASWALRCRLVRPALGRAILTTPQHDTINTVFCACGGNFRLRRLFLGFKRQSFRAFGQLFTPSHFLASPIFVILYPSDVRRW